MRSLIIGVSAIGLCISASAAFADTTHHHKIHRTHQTTMSRDLNSDQYNGYSATAPEGATTEQAAPAAATQGGKAPDFAPVEPTPPAFNHAMGTMGTPSN